MIQEILSSLGENLEIQKVLETAKDSTRLLRLVYKLLILTQVC